MSKDGFSPIEIAIIRLATPVENYGTLTEAFSALADARAHQTEDWPEVKKTDGGGRSSEEWQLLLNHYTAKLNQVYAESDGNTPEGRARYAKYASIVANISLWLVQATIGTVNDDRRIAAGIKAIGAAFDTGKKVQLDCHDGCRFHSSVGGTL